MRAAVLVVLFCAACEPDIAVGSYTCGPEELCPEGQQCDRVSNICVSPTTAQPFACGDKNVDVPSNETPATAQSLGDLACVSLVAEARSCLPPGDTGDFYTFEVVDGCTNSHVQASVVYPLAWQRLVLQIGKVGESPVTMDMTCPGDRTNDDGDAVSCLDMPVSPGTYVIGVIPDGTGNCDNECRFSRYQLGVQVTTK